MKKIEGTNDPLLHFLKHPLLGSFSDNRSLRIPYPVNYKFLHKKVGLLECVTRALVCRDITVFGNYRLV